jgi:putative addiction module component (TIGR02574 family)
MSDRVEQIAAQGRTLSPEERVRLLDLLLASLDQQPSDAIEAAWAAEIERRVKAHERGEGQLFDVESVMAEAEKIAP